MGILAQGHLLLFSPEKDLLNNPPKQIIMGK